MRAGPHRSARLVLLLATLVAAVAIAAPVAYALMVESSDRWPGGHIKVYDDSKYDLSLAEAIRQWNGSGADIELELVSDRGQADVVVYSDSRELKRHCRKCLGWASSVGRRGATSRIVMVDPYNNQQQLPSPMWTKLLVHEIGHLLGLRHSKDRCSIMIPDPERICRPVKGNRVLCGPRRMDVEQVIERYGSGGRKRVSPYCR